MIQNISKIIVRSIFAIVLILLIVESSLLVPAYMNLVFQTQAIASKGARYNYVSTDDVDNLTLNLKGISSNERYGSVDVTTTVLEITPDGNNDLTVDTVYGKDETDEKLQRGDRYTIRVDVQYYFLMPKIFDRTATTNKKIGLAIPLSYEVPITCLKYFKD